MRLPSVTEAWGRFRERFGRRGAAFALALALEGLLVLMLFFLAPAIDRKEKTRPSLFGFDVASDENEQDQTKDKAKQESKGRKSPERETIVAEKPKATQQQAQADQPETVAMPEGFIQLSRADYAASNIGALPKAAAGKADSGNGSGASGDSQLAGGKGPGGEPLYAAEWYRRPSHAELSSYMPKRSPLEGWGLIACRTIDRFQVEDCQELDESPRGSGLARAVRQAAWQFRVRPPRVGGKLMVGAWVSIRIDYTLTPER